ncbi:MAG: DUF4330 family protein [Ruminococcaceae bacterium]|nr:DUF4330 family protein [Oscillospiraceae bacterium]
MKNGERERVGGLNGLDWCILLLIAAVLVGALFWYLFRGRDMGEEREIRYTVRVFNVDTSQTDEETLRSLISVGSTVYSENGTAVLGSVETVTFSTRRIAAVRDGSVIFTEDKGHTNVDVTVRAMANAKVGDGLRVHDLRIAAGMSGGFRMGGFCAQNASVISVEVVAE